MANKNEIKQLHKLFETAELIRCVIDGANVCGYTSIGAERDWDLKSKGYYEIVVESASGSGDDWDTIQFPVQLFNEATKEEGSVWLLTDSKNQIASVQFFKLTSL
tara:strand:- start:202 stop:516 length:315 start_codon:yes stop_codon:yes gene_type:complete